MSRYTTPLVLATAIAVVWAALVGLPIYRSTTRAAARESQIAPILASLAGLDTDLTTLSADFAVCSKDLDANFLSCLHDADAALANLELALSSTKTVFADAIEEVTNAPTPTPSLFGSRATVLAAGTVGSMGLTYLHAWNSLAEAAPATPPPPPAFPPVPHIVPMAPWVGPPREVPMAPWVDAPPAPAVRRPHPAPTASHTVSLDAPPQEVVTPAASRAVANDAPPQEVAASVADTEPAHPQAQPQPQVVARSHDTDDARENTSTGDDNGHAQDDALAVDRARGPAVRARWKRPRRRRHRSRRPSHQHRAAAKHARHRGAHTQQQPVARCSRRC